MGIGDNIMASGMARGAKARGKRIAFGDGQRIIWDHNSEVVFRGNPNVARPGTERRSDVEWIKFYKGHRIYNTQVGNERWQWHPDKFKAQPGQIFLSNEEVAFGSRWGTGIVVVEPNVPVQKHCSPNKQWPLNRYEEVARQLKYLGYRVFQFVYQGCRHQLENAEKIPTKNFRMAIAVLANAKFAVLPEGGLHHGAAALGVPAVVLFGGFIPPELTGYDSHVNLTGGATACGSLNRCQHCVDAMDAISVDDVMEGVRKLTDG